MEILFRNVYDPYLIMFRNQITALQTDVQILASLRL